MRLLLIFTAVIPSFAATAFAPFDETSDEIVVPFAVGSIVLSNLTGTLYCCAGQIEAGCKILAPKYANSAASSKLRFSIGTVLFTIRGSLLCIPLMSVHISHTEAWIAAATREAV